MRFFLLSLFLVFPSSAWANWNQGRTHMGPPPALSTEWSLPLLLSAFQVIFGVIGILSFSILILSLFFTLIHFIRNKTTGKGRDLIVYSLGTLLFSIFVWTLLTLCLHGKY